MEGGRPVYPRSEIMARKPVVWLGDSLHAMRGFAAEGRRRAGQELGLVQAGEAPTDWKTMPSIGLGVKSRTTARLDVELARQRYRTLIRDRKQ